MTYFQHQPTLTHGMMTSQTSALHVEREEPSSIFSVHVALASGIHTSAAPRKKAVSALLLNWEKASFVFYADFRWLPEKSIIKKKIICGIKKYHIMLNKHTH